MEDVIFNGSDSRKPVGMAQVSLIFSNTARDTLLKYSEFNEISITRRLYRSGESQYMINKTPCRLIDIRELFMDTGIGGKAYSIIEQGKIDQIVTARAEERRSIIDEAAGIVKFKTKKKEAEKRFSLTKQNLLRVEDVLAELEKQEETLKAQVELAERYLHAKGRLEQLKKCSEATTWAQRTEKKEEVEEIREIALDRLKGLETNITSSKTNESAMQLEIALLEKKLDDISLENQKKKEEIVDLKNRIKTENLAISNLEEWLTKSNDEIEEFSQQLKATEKRIETCKKDEETLKGEIAGKDEILDHLKEKERVLSQQYSGKKKSLYSKPKSN